MIKLIGSIIDAAKTVKEINSSKSLEDYSEPKDSIWGATIHYSDDCPVNTGIIVDIDQDRSDGKNMAVFPM